MITPKDLKNPKNRSGYTGVGRSTAEREASRGHQRFFGVKPLGGNKNWYGPNRATALEAAQDYCDYVNGQKQLTIEDIRNPKRKSGFDYVGSAHSNGPRSHAGGGNWRAAINVGGTSDHSKPSWRGPRRATAEEAAQDYVDYVNGQRKATPATLPSYAAPTIDMGNTKRHAPKQEKVTVKRQEFKGPHDVYDILLLAPYTAAVIVRKVGITARSHARYADICRTFGMSIKPNAPAKTYPTKAAALAAESDLVAEVCNDKNWVRVGKEAFAPANTKDSTS